jgi:NAD(P)-dependent dehydrogenase (short-subunit alcohol dehydrogenase family)
MRSRQHRETLERNLEDLLKVATSEGREKLDHVVFTAGDRLTVTSLVDMTIQWLPTVRFVAATLLGELLVPSYMTSSAESSITLTGGVNTPHSPLSAGGSWHAGSQPVKHLARGFIVDLKPIGVTCVALGAVNTELMQSFFGDRLDAVLKPFKGYDDNGDSGRPEDLAEAYLYCMKD